MSALALNCFAANPSSTNAPDIVACNRALGRGINVGNALEQPAHKSWGVQLKADYFARIASAGFAAVRIPVRWSDHAATSAPYRIAAAFFTNVDTVVRWALQHNLCVVLNIHHYHELMANPAAHRPRFLALWRQIATHYHAWPERLYFEVLNEPNDALTPDVWNALLRDALAVIRATHPTRPVIVGSAEWNGISALPQLSLPPDDRHLIVTIHYYNPFRFTHQGAEWVPDMQNVRDVAWHGTTAEVAAIEADFAKVAAWAREHQRPVYVGEFGAYSTADMASRARWTACVARTAERYGMSWAYWEFCSGFGAYDPRTDTWRLPLLHALLPTREQ